VDVALALGQSGDDPGPRDYIDRPVGIGPQRGLQLVRSAAKRPPSSCSSVISSISASIASRCVCCGVAIAIRALEG
jgi:hypothetical protein